MTRKAPSAGFTLLELVTVLAILAIVTTLALQAVDRVQDQKRHETAQRGLEEISAAVLGDPDDRAADGTRTISGFVADLGRLPQAVIRNVEGTSMFTLAELWESGLLPSFDVRRANLTNLQVPNVADVDEQVQIGGGWRGPYLRLPLGSTGVIDGWGNPIATPVDASALNPQTNGYGRLRTADDLPISAAGQEICLIGHLGANGTHQSADVGYDQDTVISWTNLPGTPLDDQHRATLVGQVEVLDGDSPADPSLSSTDTITIRIYGPSETDPKKISVVQVTLPFEQNPVLFPTALLPFDGLPTIGPRVVRARYNPDGVAATTYRRSAVRQVTLRQGINLIDLKIDR